jgi:hypothetical protein
VKENQKTLYQNSKDYFEGMESGEIRDLPEDLWQGKEENGHGRKERREVRTVTDLEGWSTKPSKHGPGGSILSTGIDGTTG